MINGVGVRLSPSHQQHIRFMDENVNEMQKENRQQWATLIQKQSDLSHRQHKLLVQELERKRLKKELKSKQEIMKECSAEVNSYKEQIEKIKNELFKNQKTIVLIENKMENYVAPDLAPIKETVLKRKKNVNEILKQTLDLKNKLRSIDEENAHLSKIVEARQILLSKYNSQKKKIQEILQIPIDDLRLEDITVSKLESVVDSQSDIISEKDNNNNNNFSPQTIKNKLKIKKLEQSNKERKIQIEIMKKRIDEIKKNIPITPQKVAINSPKTAKGLKKIPSVKLDESRVSQYNNSIESLKERQNAIDQLERATTTLQVYWANDQKQIESSWMSKMSDMNQMQKRVEENERLQFDIDEISERIQQLKIKLLDIQEKKVTFSKEKSKIESRLDTIGLSHSEMQSKVDDYLKRKQDVNEFEEKLKVKREKILKMKKEINLHENNYKKYRLKVESLEEEVLKKSGKIDAAAKSQVLKSRDHVHFIQNSRDMNWKPKTPYPIRTQKNAVISGSSHCSSAQKHQEQLMTPNSKLNQTKKFNSKEAFNDGDTFSESESLIEAETEINSINSEINNCLDLNENRIAHVKQSKFVSQIDEEMGEDDQPRFSFQSESTTNDDIGNENDFNKRQDKIRQDSSNYKNNNSKKFNDDEVFINKEEEEEEADEEFEEKLPHSSKKQQSSKKEGQMSSCFPAPENFDDTFDSEQDENRNHLNNGDDEGNVENVEEEEEEEDNFDDDVNDTKEGEILSNHSKFQTEYKNSFSSSTASQISPKRSSNYSELSSINDSNFSLQSPKINKFDRKSKNDSDEEYDSLIREAQKAIEMPVMQSRYLLSSNS